jgi:hypothetical protein
MNNWRVWRPRRAVVAALLVTLAAACNGFDPLDPSLSAVMITRDPPEDVYGLTVNEAGVITASAPSTNTGGNNRAVFWRNADPVSTDQESCATWTAADQGQQPGIALRAHDVAGGTQVITVTKNVWFYGFSIFNVHVMDSSDADQPFVLIAGQDLPGMRSSESFNDVKPYPWRGCARVIGRVISLKIWPVAEPEPSWDDPSYGYSVTLPDDWEVTAGHGGSYIGHLPPGGTIYYSELTITSLDPAPSPAAAARAASLAEPTTPPLDPTHILRAP